MAALRAGVGLVVAEDIRRVGQRKIEVFGRGAAARCIRGVCCILTKTGVLHQIHRWKNGEAILYPAGECPLIVPGIDLSLVYPIENVLPIAGRKRILENID